MSTTLQTLDRGLRVLEIVSEHTDGVTIAELAQQLGIHRAIAYRIVTTLESHCLITRTVEGLIRLGAGMTLLASRFEPQLRSVAQPLLRSLARATRATSFLSVAQAEECVVIMVEEPSEGMLRVGYRVGSRHPLTQGAAGIAILSGRLPNQDDDEVVRKARDDGYSLTCGQLQRGAVGVASPLIAARLGNGVEACIGVVALEDMDTERAICEVKASAKQLAKLIGQ